MISVIIPVYNAEEYLAECVDSVRRQTFSDLEIILVDDGSTDGSPRICEEYREKDPRVKAVHQANGGLVGARKAGLREATGEYIGYVDSDDWIEPDMYGKLLAALADGEADVAMCGRFEDTGDVRREVRHGLPAGRYDRKALMERVYPNMIVNGAFFEWGIFPGVWDKLFRRECVERFQMEVDGRIVMGEDAACTYPCLLNAGGIHILHDCLYHYRQTLSSMVKRVQDYEKERMQFRTLFQTVDRSLGRYAGIFDLRPQWREYILFLMVPRADGLYRGVAEMDFLFPFPGVRKGMDIVLYGAGTYGQRLYRFLEETGFCRVVAWVDRNHAELRRMGLPVEGPDAIPGRRYDAVVIANTYDRSRKNLYRELTERYGEERIHMLDEELVFSPETWQAFGLSGGGAG